MGQICRYPARLKELGIISKMKNQPDKIFKEVQEQKLHIIVDKPDLGEGYEVLSLIGQGGMGAVWKVRDKALNKTLAIKLLRPELAGDRIAAKRFEQEAQAAASLTQANLVAVYGFGKANDESPFLIMDYLQGENLATVLAKDVYLPVARMLDLTTQICEALMHAHAKGIVHRDIKPSNVIITKSEDGNDIVKVVDFGLAKVMPTINDQTNNLTQTGELFGTPNYMSPEQCLSEEIDARSDIYSLGCLMFESLCGKPVFQNTNPIKVILGHINEAPDFSQLKKNGVPTDLIDIISICLSKKPAARYQSMKDLDQDLERVKAGEKPDSKKYKETTALAHSKAPTNPYRGSTTAGMSAQKQLKVFGVAFIFGAVICFLMQFSSVQKSIASADWPTADAKVTASQILYQRNLDGTPKLNVNGSLDLRYQYSVKGVKYSANRYKLFGMMPNNANLEKIVESHPVNSTIKIHYNPQNNAEACVESGSTSADPWSTIFYSSGGLLALGLLLTMLSALLGKADLPDNANRPKGSKPAPLAQLAAKRDRQMAILRPAGIVLIMVIAAIACRFLIPR